MGNGYEADHHEFLITPEDTALIDIYYKVPTDLSGLGGEKDQNVLDGIVHEVDIKTGEVLFEWHSLEHVGFDESYIKPYDYFHINSVELDLDGNLLVSSRSTSTVYKIDRKSGDVIWRLGGKMSDFEMSPGTRTAIDEVKGLSSLNFLVPRRVAVAFNEPGERRSGGYWRHGRRRARG